MAMVATMIASPVHGASKKERQAKADKLVADTAKKLDTAIQNIGKATTVKQVEEALATTDVSAIDTLDSDLGTNTSPVTTAIPKVIEAVSKKGLTSTAVSAAVRMLTQELTDLSDGKQAAAPAAVEVRSRDISAPSSPKKPASVADAIATANSIDAAKAAAKAEDDLAQVALNAAKAKIDKIDAEVAKVEAERKETADALTAARNATTLQEAQAAAARAKTNRLEAEAALQVANKAADDKAAAQAKAAQDEADAKNLAEANTRVATMVSRLGDVTNRIAKSTVTSGKAITNAANLRDELKTLIDSKLGVATTTGLSMVTLPNFTTIVNAINAFVAKLDADTRQPFTGSSFSNYPVLSTSSSPKLSEVQTQMKSLGSVIEGHYNLIAKSGVSMPSALVTAVNGMKNWTGPKK